MKDYIHLLRQRREHNKLEILQQALTTLVDNEPNPSRVDVNDFVKEELGEPPQAPIGAIDQKQAFDRVEELTFRLKKELLIAKARLEEANKARIESEKRAAAASPLSLEAQIAALRRARDYMIGWVEGELGKIPENDGDTSQAEISMVENEEPQPPELSDEDLSAKIYELYAVYITARERLIATVDATTKISQVPKASEYDASPSSSRSTTRHSNVSTQPIRATDILPYLRTLLQASREESSLLQQSSHLRRQLALASEETDRTVQRLAGESHLVPQDTIEMGAWSKAADEAAEKTNAFVEIQVQTGEQSLEKAKDVLDKLETRRKAWETLKGDV